MPDVEGKNSSRRYRSKLAHLLGKGWDPIVARRKAAGYAGGKTVPGKSKEEGGEIGLPYQSASDLPEAVRDALPPEAHSIWMAAFNHAYEEGTGESEAAAAAWAAVKKAGYTKDEETGKWVKASEPAAAGGERKTIYRLSTTEGKLSFDQIRDKIASQLRQGRPWVDLWVRELYDDQAIVSSYQSGSERLFRVAYTIQDGEVVLGDTQEVEQKVSYEPIQACERAMGVIALDEELPGDTSEIEILRTGSWNHPEYGKFKVSETDLDGFIESFEGNVRGVDLAIDQAHKPDEGAAGWFRKLYKKATETGTSLWAKIEWTPLGKELIEHKIFRYISPEFTFKYKDDETGQTTKNVLYGAALTNRPFIKGMAPVMLSEDQAVELTAEEIAVLSGRFWLAEPGEEDPEPHPGTTKGVDGEVKLEELRKALGLAETADETAIGAALTTLKAQAAQGQGLAEIAKALKLGEKAGQTEVLQVINDLTVKANEAKEKVSGKESEVRALQEENTKLSTRVTTLEDKLRLAEWKEISGKLLSEGRMTAKQEPVYRERFMKDPEGTKPLLDLLEPVVEFGERGSQRDRESNIRVFDEKISLKLKENPSLGYAEAAQIVAQEDPALWAEVDRERRGER